MIGNGRRGTGARSPSGPSGDDPRRTGHAAGDGRNISGDLGLLEGEGAQQNFPRDRAFSEGAVPSGVWTRSAAAGIDESPAYYDRPVIKEPVWIWAVPVYFFCGGAAGAAAVLGEASRLVSPADFGRLSARCRWIAAAGTTAGGVLLIYDLGRPARFFNMLRVFRPTSAMSMGSWILALSGVMSGAAAALTGRKGARGAASDAAAAASAVLGLPLAGYTAVLLSDTAVPLWQQVRKSLPALFVSSAGASAAALLKMLPQDRASGRVVQHFGIVATAAEIASAFAVDGQAKQVERVARPLKEGLPGYLWRSSKVLSAASLAFALAERGSRRRQVASGLLAIAGGFALRFAVFHAGKESARDPRATFDQQRLDAKM